MKSFEQAKKDTLIADEMFIKNMMTYSVWKKITTLNKEIMYGYLQKKMDEQIVKSLISDTKS